MLRNYCMKAYATLTVHFLSCRVESRDEIPSSLPSPLVYVKLNTKQLEKTQITVF